MRFCFILMVVLPAFAANVTTVRRDVHSGRLVRVAPPAAQVKLPPDAAQMIAMVDQIAEAEGVESALVHSVIRAESNYNPMAVSAKGAMGIMQLIPSTAQRFGVTNALDAHDNLQGGVRYLRFLLDYYQGDYPRTIAAYNAGEGAVDKFNGIPPFPETRSYVWQVAKNLKEVRKARPVAAMEPPANRMTETVRPIQVSVDADGRTWYRTP